MSSPPSARLSLLRLTGATILAVAPGLLTASLLPAQTATTRQLSVTPDSLRLYPGDTARLVPTVRAGAGAVVANAAVTWSSLDTSLVTVRSGKVTAKQRLGCTVIRPQHSTYVRTQIAACVVARPVTPTPVPPVDTAPTPPPSGSFTPNLPSGLTRVVDTEFGGLLNQQINASGLAYHWDGRNAVDPSAPFSPDVFEIFYPGNDYGNGVGGATLYSAEGNQWRRIYWSLMLWVPANYSMHTNGEKFFYPLVRTGSSITGANLFNWYVHGGVGDQPDGATWTLGVENIFPDQRLHQNRAARMRKGVWQRVEFYPEINTPGQSNGVWRMWVDGALALEFTNMRFSNAGAQSGWDGIRFEGVRGGGTSAVPTPAGGQVRRYSRLAFYASQ